MKLSEAFPGKYLKADDLGDEDVAVTIKDCTQEMVGQGSDASLKLVLMFREFDKGLICNKTNAKVIAKLYGDDTDDWTGKKIVLWVNHDVQFGNEVVSAIRVRSKAPTSAANGNGQATTTNDILLLDQAIEACEKAGLKRADLVNYLKSHGITAYNARRDTPVVRTFLAGVAPLPPDDVKLDDTDDVPF